MTSEDSEVVNGGGGGGVGPVLQLLSNMEDENEIENMETEEIEKEELLPYLDEGVITKILSKIHSAESLYNSLRYVCKLWYNIISHHPDIQLNSLLPSSKPPCIIIQNTDNSTIEYIRSIPEEEAVAMLINRNYTTCFLRMRIKEGDIEIEQQVDLTPNLKKLRIKDCCNGLILATPEGRGNSMTLCIVNPITNHQLVLPPRPIYGNSGPVPLFTFLPSTGKYKVFTTGRDRFCEPPRNFIQILTMSSSPPAAGRCSGSSSDGDGDPCRHWRLIEAPDCLHYQPIAINGVYYWASGGEDYIISFDAASEEFYTTPHELHRNIENIFENRYYQGFMDLGGYLAFWFFRPTELGAEAKNRTFNVHVIEDLHKKGGEWKELYSGISMDLDFIKARNVRPVLSVGNGEVIIFMNSEEYTLWAYHFKSQRWLKVGNNLKELDHMNFCDYHAKSNIHVPFDSLFSLKQTTVVSNS